MGYLYRPKLMSSPKTLPKGVKCTHKDHGKKDVCPACQAKFCKLWWVKYCANGRVICESTGATGIKKAEKFMKDREGSAVKGQPILPRVDKIRYEEAAKDLREHYKSTGDRDIVEAEKRLKHLDCFFRNRRIYLIRQAEASSYVAARKLDGVANGTINRELAILGRMLKLAFENEKLLRLPIIRKLKEADPRSGFFERGQFEAVKRHLRPDLQVAVSIAYAYGWRMQSEVLTLKRNQVDLGACTIRLDMGSTKNDDGRLVYLTPELVEMLQAQHERIQILEMRTGRPVPYLFPYLGGRHRSQRICDFRKAWAQACLEATLDLEGLDGEQRETRKAEIEQAEARGERPGLLKMLRHDLRRTAVRNLVNNGVPERVAMKITGHKTRSVFDRYHIVSPGDLQDAARKLTGTFSGTLPEERSGNPQQLREIVVAAGGFEPPT